MLWRSWWTVVRPGSFVALAFIFPSVAYGAVYVLTPGEAGRLVDAAISDKGLNLTRLPVLVLILVSTMSALVVLGSHLAVTTAERLRQRLFRSLEQGGGATSIESVATRCTNDVLIIQGFVGQLAAIAVPSIGLVVISIVAATAVDPVLAAPVLASLPMLVVVVLAVARAAAARARPVHEALDVLSQKTKDILDGGHLLRTIPGAAQSKSVVHMSERLSANATAVGYATSLLVPVTLTLTGAISVGVVGLGLSRIDSGLTTPGEVVEFVGYVGLVARGILGTSGSLQLFPTAAESLRRINEILLAGRNDLIVRAQMGGDGTAVMLVDGTISHGPSAEPVLRDVDLSVPTDAYLNVVGRSGSGKTALLEALAGMRSLESGELFVHSRGLDQYGRLDALRNILVSAESTLTAGTIRTSIGLARAGAGDDEIWDALEACQVADLIKSRGGLDCPVEYGAANFSGGERHRLTLARAVLARPIILLADDPFRSLDGETGHRLEAEFQDLEQMAVVIARRHLRSGDGDGRVVLLEAGIIAGNGTHARLLEQNTLYRRLHEQQTP